MKRCRVHKLARLLILLLVETVVLLVDLADGYAWCREYWNWDGRRRTNDGRRWPAGDGKVITYVNGIFHSVPEWEAITHQLQAMFGHEVRPFYNPSSGWWITDASKAGFTLLRRPANDSLAKALGDHLAQAVDDVGKGRVLHIAHSGGALVTYLAAQHHLTKRQRDKIDVLTFGGAVSITRKYFRGRVVNYYARNDPLVKLDRRAAELMKLTNDTEFQEVYEKHNTTFVFLEGRAGDFVQDHSLEGPTYQYALRKEARAFRRAHFGPLSPLAWDYDTSLLRLTRKKVAEISGVHSFFSGERFGPRAVRKAVALLTGFHGFFSGKVPGSGVQVAIVGDGGRALQDRSANITGVSILVRRMWPWGRKSDEKSAALRSEDTAPPQDRLWLGFRWGRRNTKTGVDVDGPLTIDELGTDSEDEESPQSGRWVQLLKTVGLVREQSAAHTGSGGVEVDASLAARADEEQGSLQEARADGEQSLLSVSRPWLSTGWVPWGSPPKAVEESSKSTALVTGSSGAAEEGGHGGQNGEIEDTAGKSTQQEDAEQTPTGDLLLEGLSYLWGWWPTSSSNSSSITTQETETAGKENLAKERSNEDAALENQEEGHEKGQGHDEGDLLLEGKSSLWGWWPTSSSNSSITTQKTETAGKENLAKERLNEDAALENQEEGQGEGHEEGDLLLEGMSSLWGWWPTSSSNSSITTQETETAGKENLAKERSDEDAALENQEEGHEKGQGHEEGGVGGGAKSAVAATSSKEEASIFRRWLPLAKTQGDEQEAGNVTSAGGEEIGSQAGVDVILAENGATGATQVERAGIALEPTEVSPEPSNSWRLWQALKGAVTFSSEPRDDADAAPNVEEMPISPEAEAGTIADSPSATAGLDDVRGEVVLIEGQIKQDGEPELAEQPLVGTQPLVGSHCSETGSDALEAGSEALEAGSEALEAGSEALEAVTEALEAVTEALDTVNKALEAGSEALEARNEALEARNEALEARNEALEAGSEALEAGSEALETGGGSGERITSVVIMPSLDGEDVRIDYENVNTDTSIMAISADSSGAGVGEKEALELGVGDLGDIEVVVESDTEGDGDDSSEGSDGSECSDGSKGRVSSPAESEASTGHEKDRREQKTGNRIWGWLR